MTTGSAGLGGSPIDTPHSPNLENVFYCKTDEFVKSLDADSAICPKCENKMELIGWFEIPRNSE